jgi:hypothetical protein
MENLFREINKKINGMIWSLVSTGVILLILAILIVWTNFMLQLVVSMLVIVVAYMFIYSGYKIWTFKKAIKNHFKF